MPHNLNRRTILKMLGYTVVGSGVTAFGIHRYGTRIETEWLQTERVSIPVKHLGSSFEGFKIVHLSDFHLYPQTRTVVPRRTNRQIDFFAAVEVAS